MGKLATLALLLFTFIAARQIYDEGVPCLRIGDNCEETPYQFKDDSLSLPYESEGESSIPSEEFEDGDSPFGDEDYVEA
jgi:hypothetical protein